MITKFMVTIGPIHEKDLSDVCKQLEHYADIRVSTYNSQKIKRVVSKAPIVRKTVTPEAKIEMQKLRDEGCKLNDIVTQTGYAAITVKRHTVDAQGRQTL
jgi:hypothetical protein